MALNELTGSGPIAGSPHFQPSTSQYRAPGGT